MTKFEKGERRGKKRKYMLRKMDQYPGGVSVSKNQQGGGEIKSVGGDGRGVWFGESKGMA